MSMMGKALQMGIMAWSTSSVYHEKREEGYSKMSAMGRAGVDLALISTAMGPYMAVTMAPSLASAGAGVASYIDKKRSFYKSAGRPGLIGRGFQDTDATYTMRQRGVQAILTSRMNARNSMGNEAAMMHGGVRY